MANLNNSTNLTDVKHSDQVVAKLNKIHPSDFGGDTAKAVALYIADQSWASSGFTCKRYVAAIAEAIGKTTRTVRRQLVTLSEKGWITIQHQKSTIIKAMNLASIYGLGEAVWALFRPRVSTPGSQCQAKDQTPPTKKKKKNIYKGIFVSAETKKALYDGTATPEQVLEAKADFKALGWKWNYPQYDQKGRLQKIGAKANDDIAKREAEDAKRKKEAGARGANKPTNNNGETQTTFNASRFTESTHAHAKTLSNAKANKSTTTTAKGFLASIRQKLA